MAENIGETKMGNTHTPATSINPYGRVDQELGSVAELRDERRKRSAKCFAYVFAFSVFQIGIMLLIALIVMKAKTPKFRLRSATFEDFQVSTLSTNSSFNVRMIAELGIKNTNFGPYKYQNSTIEFFYQDIKVGEAFVPHARAKARSTRKFSVTLDLSSSNVPGQELGNELLQHAWIPLSSRSNLRGNVKILGVLKKKKSTNMNCSMNLNISSRVLQDLKCK